MNTEALALMALFFFHGHFVNPSLFAPLVAMAFIPRDPSKTDDGIIKKWQKEYAPPNPLVLWLTDKKNNESDVTVVYDIKEGEKVPPSWNNLYGLVIIDYSKQFTNLRWLLNYADSIAAPGGSILILEGRRVWMHLSK